MTLLVALVRSVADAETAVAAGVDRIAVQADLPPCLSTIGALARSRCPVSLWWGESGAQQAGADLATALAACGADEVWGWTENTPPRVRTWGVVAPGDAAAAVAAAVEGCEGVLIAGGGSRDRLLRTVTIADLEKQHRGALAHKVSIGIAGGMEAPDVPRLLAFSPDRLVLDDLIRQDGTSSSPIVPHRVQLVRDLMAVSRAADRALPLAAVPAQPDRIFVRDWIAALHLGAYGHEIDAQRVRFSVEAAVTPHTRGAADMRDVVTYDLITDAIARATVTHVALVETIAEHIATLVLAHPRVEAVDITVEKLDLGPGSLGCRITRRRA